METTNTSTTNQQLDVPPSDLVVPSLPFKPYYDKAGITIYNEDCRKVLPWLGKFDLLLTDPPYGIGYDKTAKSNSGKRSKNGAAFKTIHTISGWDDSPPSRWLIDQCVDQCKNSIVWGGNYFEVDPSRCWLFWDKKNDGKTFADGEMAWTNLKGSVRRIEYLWDGMIQQNMKDKDVRLHPTQKPLAVMRWCLGLVKDAESILDPFMGSGTTLVAAKAEGRKAVGIEINEAYCEVAANRLAQGVLF